MSAGTRPVPDVEDGGKPETVPVERGFGARYGGTVGVWTARIVLVAALLLVWQWAADRWFDVIFTSRPSEIWERLVEWHQDGILWSNTWVTIQEILYGFALGAAAGVLLGFLLASATVLYRVLDPFIMALYSIPKVALAPLFIVWFGIGMNMKVLLAAATVFFLVFLNTVAGVREVDRGLIDAVRLMGGGRWHVTFKVVLPGSMTGVLTGLKVAIPYALIGAVIGELVASNRLVLGAAGCASRTSTTPPGVLNVGQISNSIAFFPLFIAEQKKTATRPRGG